MNPWFHEDVELFHVFWELQILMTARTKMLERRQIVGLSLLDYETNQQKYRQLYLHAQNLSAKIGPERTQKIASQLKNLKQ